MEERLGPEILGREWYRSSGYVLIDGMLRLREGARLERYDPWAAWRISADEERPYKSLLRLAQRLEITRTPAGPALGTHQRQLLEAWVRRNGLLGILPHETLQVRSAPRWVDERDLFPSEGPEPTGVSVLLPVQEESQRGALGWVRSHSQPGYARETDRARIGEVVFEERLGAPWQPVEALYRRLPKGRLWRAPLSEYWHGFFPDVPPAEALTCAYPHPGSAAFWRGYGEPLGRFVATAQTLARAVAAWGQIQQGGLADEDQTSAWRAMAAINAMAAAVQPAGMLNEQGALRLTWSSPSLLGCFAVMILSDLAAGQLVRSCPNCGVFFLSGNRKAIYCSSTCRYAFQKRAWRAGKSQAGR